MVNVIPGFNPSTMENKNKAPSKEESTTVGPGDLAQPPVDQSVGHQLLGLAWDSGDSRAFSFSLKWHWAIRLIWSLSSNQVEGH